jgi:hypothetical protein
MSLADACLVRLAELHDKPRVWTLDSDFRVYRRLGRLIIPMLTPGRKKRLNLKPLWLNRDSAG